MFGPAFEALSLPVDVHVHASVTDGTLRHLTSVDGVKFASIREHLFVEPVWCSSVCGAHVVESTFACNVGCSADEHAVVSIEVGATATGGIEYNMSDCTLSDLVRVDGLSLDAVCCVPPEVIRAAVVYVYSAVVGEFGHADVVGVSAGVDFTVCCVESAESGV